MATTQLMYDGSKTLSPLCHACSNAFYNQLSGVEFPIDTPCHPYIPMQHYEFIHHQSLVAFHKAKEDGCHLCYLLWKQLLKKWVHKLGDPTKKQFFKKDFHITWTATDDRRDSTLMFYAH